MFMPSSLRPTDNFSKAALQLSRGLEHLNLEPPPLPELQVQLGEYFDLQCLEYAHNLQHLKQDHAWQLLKVPASLVGGDGLESFVVCPAADSALAWVIKRFDENLSVLTGARREPDGAITLLWNGMPQVTISRVQFEDVPMDQSERVEEALKQTQQRGDGPRIEKRLSAIPGLQGIQVSPKGIARPEGPPTIITPTSLVIQLRKMLAAEFLISVKHSQALELTARMFGALSWNHFVGKNKTRLCYRLPVVLYKRWKDFEIYRTAGEAIWALSQHCRGVPGLCIHLRPVGFYSDGPELVVDEKQRHQMEDKALPVGVTYFMDVHEDDIKYLRLARELLESPEINDDVRDLYSNDIETTWSRANARLGRQRELKLGRWLFSLQVADTPQRTMLHADRADYPSLGTSALLHKIELWQHGGTVWIFGDRGQALLLREQWLPKHIAAFCTFTGVIAKQGLPPEKYATVFASHRGPMEQERFAENI